MYDRDRDPAYDDPVEDRYRGERGGPRYDREREVIREERYVDGRPPYEPAGPVAPYNYRAVQVAWFCFGLIVALIALRFALKLLGASSQAEFVGFIYGITSPLVAPFRGIFPDTAQGFYVFEASSLVAIVIYLLLAWAVVALIRILTAPRRRPTA